MNHYHHILLLLIDQMYIILFRFICFINKVNRRIFIYLHKFPEHQDFPITFLWITQNNPAAFFPLSKCISSPETLYATPLFIISLKTDQMYTILFIFCFVNKVKSESLFFWKVSIKSEFVPSHSCG